MCESLNHLISHKPWGNPIHELASIYDSVVICKLTSIYKTALTHETTYITLRQPTSRRHPQKVRHQQWVRHPREAVNRGIGYMSYRGLGLSYQKNLQHIRLIYIYNFLELYPNGFLVQKCTHLWGTYYWSKLFLRNPKGQFLCLSNTKEEGGSGSNY